MRKKLNKLDRNLILASSSKVRSEVLKTAGLSFSVYPANLDEAAEKKDAGKQTVYKISQVLAKKKALQISQVYKESFVIGADQVLECDGKLFDKPFDKETARKHLFKLRGKTHILISTVCVALNGQVIWQKTDSAYLTMLNLSNSFIDRYLEIAGDTVLSSVGAYCLEGVGVQLFDKIEGDYFTILGVPLLPLLEFLRTKELLER